MADMSSSGPSAGSRRFWVTVAIFALLNLAAWAGYDRWQVSRAPRRDILAVLNFTPGERAPVGQEEGPPELTWTFNIDAGKPGRVKGGPRGEMPGTIKPSVSGDWRWTDPRTLVFVSREKLPRATRFTATLDPNSLRSPEGFTLAKPETHMFMTEPLAVESITQAAFDNENRILLEIRFNDKVIPGEVLQHLEIDGPDGKRVHAELHGEGAGNIVRVLTDPIPAFKRVAASKRTAGLVPPNGDTGRIDLTVILTKGLAGTSGPLGLDDDVIRQVEIADALVAESADAGNDGEPAICVHFNNDISQEMLEAMQPLLSVEPAVKFTADRRTSWAGREILLRGTFEPGKRYTVSIAKVTTADDRRKYPRPAVMSVFIPDRAPTVYFEHASGYLGSKGNRTILVKSVNLPAIRIRAMRLYENNLVMWRNNTSSIADFSRPVATRRYVLANRKNEVEALAVNLDELLGARNAADGVYELQVVPDTKGPAADDEDSDDVRAWRRARNYQYDDSTIVTLSDIGLTAKLSGEAGGNQSLLAWAVSLSTGKPMSGVTVHFYSDKNQLLGEAATDKDGLARIEHVTTAAGEKPSVVSAKVGNGSGNGEEIGLTWLDLSSGQHDESRFETAGRAYLRTGCEAFVWRERGVYRPGETAVLRAVVRGAAMSVPPAKMPLRWQMRRPDGQDWIAQATAVNEDGAVEWRVTFPADAQTGYWTAQLGLPGDPESGSSGMSVFGSVEIQVEEFVPDRMKVGASLQGAGLDGEPARFAIGEKPLLIGVQGDYLFGQPAATLGAGVNVRLSPTPFVTKNFLSSDGWFSGDTVDAAAVLAPAHHDLGRIEPMQKKLDAEGHARFEADLGGVVGSDAKDLFAYRGPWDVWVSAGVSETGGRTVTAYAATEADLLPCYVMARGRNVNTDGYVAIGTEAAYDVRLVTPKGESLKEADRVTVSIYREEWETVLVQSNGRYHYDSRRTLNKVEAANALVNASPGGATYAYNADHTGTYVLLFSDPSAHHITSTRLTVGEPGGWSDNVSREHPEELQVQLATADGAKPLFHPGQQVKAIVKSPFAGELLLTFESDHVVSTRVVEMKASTAEVAVEIPEEEVPNAYVSATVVRAVEPNGKWGTHRAFGICRFMMDHSAYALVVRVDAPREMRPQQQLDVQMTVMQPDQQPVANAAVALAAVDEGILQLTGYETPRPLTYFEATRALGVETADVYGDLMPELAKESAVGGDAKSGFTRRHSSPVAAKRVRPVSLVSDVVHTDANGRATVHLQVPEFLGRLRIMAVAYAGSRVGSGEGGVIVRSPLVVQTSFPRFLAPGDSCTTPLVVINNSASAGEAHVHVTVDSADLLAIASASESVTLRPKEQKALSFTFKAGNAIGVAHVSVEAELGSEIFSEHVELPIRPASVMLSRGGSAIAKTETPAEIAIPSGMLKGSETFRIRISQGPLLGLAEGLDYLNRYPYGCLEQTTSTAFPLLYLKDISDKLYPDAAAMYGTERKVNAAIIRLMGMQTASGGFAMWPGGTQEWPWGTVYASHFLCEAKAAGFTVPPDVEARVLAYLRSLLIKSAEPGDGTEVQAYTCYVLALEGHAERAMMNRIGEILEAEAKRGNTAGLQETRFHLALAWAAAGRRDLAAALLPEEVPTFDFPRTNDGTLSSPSRDRALLALTLMSARPDDPVIPQLLEGLGASQRQWLNTQENALAVMAIGKYLRTTAGESAYDVAHILNGGQVVAMAEKKALVWTAPAGDGRFTISVDAPAHAKAFVEWLQTGIPLEMPANADHGVKVRREYLTEEGQPLDINTITSGQAIRVRLTVDASTILANFVMEDLLPAGLEIENPRLLTAKKSDTQELGILPERMDVRDDRVVIVANIAAGESSWSYLARAVTPGEYVIPPVRGECMYDAGINSIYRNGEHLTVAPNK